MSATPSETTPPSGTSVEGLTLQLPGRIHAAGKGWDWIVEGWRLFVKAPLMWIIALIIVFVINLVLGFIPLAGQIAVQVLSPVFAAGFVSACWSLEHGGEFELDQLFAGFRRNLGSLAVVGLLLLLGEIVIVVVFGAFVGFPIIMAMMTGGGDSAAALLAVTSMTVALGGLVALGLAVPLMAAYWLAPALVMLNGMAPLAAMKASFLGSFRNFIPFLIYGLIMLVFGILASIPIGLGLLVWFPVAVASTYASYRWIFTDPPPDIPAA